MRRRPYPRDPYWITARYDGTCRRCSAVILRGTRAWYYPHGNALYCSADACGGDCAREFAAAIMDERSSTGSY